METKYVASPTGSDLAEAAELLKNGELVAFPTETVYGLGANGYDKEAAKKVYAAKGRPSDNPLILHFARAEQVLACANPSALFWKLAAAFMPGPLTVILPKKAVVPDEVTGGLDTVAVRVPSHPTAHALLELCDFPVAAPSANLSGKPSPTTARHVIDDLSGKIAMILDGGACSVGVESTIVSLHDDEMTLLRPGAVTPEMLSPFCKTFTVDPALERPLADGQRPLAPGMKYKHYAPKAQVVLLDGAPEEVRAFQYAAADDPCVGLLLRAEKVDRVRYPRALALGQDAKEEAHRLFFCLRAFDEMPEVTTVYAPLPRKEGVGLAVYNRLLKAAGFTVQKI